MIRPLRHRHYQIFLALGIFLPVAFAVGIAMRRPMAADASLPAALATSRLATETVWSRSDLFANTPVKVALQRETVSGRLALALAAPPDFLKPDLLTYWVAGNPAITNTLPDNAILLGAFGPTPLRLTDPATASDGRLLLYSLADGEIVAVSKSVSLAQPSVSNH